MKYKVLLILVLTAFSTITFAEGGCPPGSYPAAPPATNVCNPFPSPRNSQIPKTSGHWETRWGSIASGLTSFGTVVGMRSKRLAEKSALSKCKASGDGKGCEVWLSFYNQCGVVVIGASSMSTAGGPTIEEATQIAKKKCEIKNTTCKVYYAECSYAEWVQ